MKTSRLLTLVSSALVGLFILSGSIAAVILCRPFYALHIYLLDLPGKVGLSAAEIKQAYGEVMDYCIGLRRTFSAGIFPFSQSGAMHFQDVRVLFRLDLLVCFLSPLFLGGLHFFSRKRNLCPYRFRGFGPLFWGPVFLAILFAVLGALAALDFNTAFTTFHRLFFPGKNNWLLSFETDPIIYVLPQVFFRNCAIFILGNLLLLDLIFIGADLRQKKKLCIRRSSPERQPSRQTG